MESEKAMPKKRGEKALGGKKKSKSSKKSSRKAKRISFERMASGHMKAKHQYDDGGEPPEGEHVVEDGSADDHLAEHLAPPPQAMAAPNVNPGSMMGNM